MRYSTLSVAELHAIAKELRDKMTPAEINAAARFARANMRLTAKLKDQWRRQCRDELGEVDDNWQQLGTVARRVIGGLR